MGKNPLASPVNPWGLFPQPNLRSWIWGIVGSVIFIFGVVPTDAVEARQVQIERVRNLIATDRLVEARPDMLALSREAEGELKVRFEFYIALSYIFEYFERGNTAALDEAVKRFEEFLRSHPRNDFSALARYNLADAHAARGELEKALEHYLPLYRNPPAGIGSEVILDKIIRIHIALGKWVEGEPFFNDGFRFGQDNSARATAAAYLVIARAQMGNLGDVRGLLRFLRAPEPVFFTPRFNAAMMEVGDQLFEQSNLALANLFYQLVRPHEELEANLVLYVSDLEARLATAENTGRGRDLVVETRAVLETTQRELEALRNSVSYTPLLSWRIARTHAEMGRHWEAFWRFRSLVNNFPNHPQAEDILFTAFSLAIELNNFPEVRALAELYYRNSAFQRFQAIVVDRLAALHLEEREWSELNELMHEYLKINSDDMAARQLVFRNGMARLSRLENDRLIAEYTDLLRRYPGSGISEELEYFLGLVFLVESRFEEALAKFNSLLERSNSRYAIDARFRRALATLGLDEVETARDLLESFIRDHGDNRLRAEAEMMLGQVYVFLGRLEDALLRYQNVPTYTENTTLKASAILARAGLLRDDLRRGGEAMALLEDFRELYRDEPEVLPVYRRMATYRQEDGDWVGAHSLLREAADLFIASIEVDAVGLLLTEYLELDAQLREMISETRQFWEILQSDEALRIQLARDRAVQFRFFQANSSLDPSIRRYFTRDNAFREAVTESFAPVAALRERLEEGYQCVPGQTAVDWLDEEKAAAQAHGQVALEVRIEAALAGRSTPPVAPSPERLALLDDPGIWESLDSIGQFWILRGISQDDPARAVPFLEEMAIIYADGALELEIHQRLARLYENLGMVDEAVRRHRLIISRFSGKVEAGQSALSLGNLLISRQRADEGREAVQQILQRNEWRGQLHAEALLVLGRSYAVEGRHSEAIGFFERIILGYPSFTEALAMAYYFTLNSLREMGARSDVERVYNAFRQTPGLSGTRGAQLVEETPWL